MHNIGAVLRSCEAVGIPEVYILHTEKRIQEYFEELEREIKRLGGVVRAEENKNKSLVDQIRKKDQDIQGMLKKKVREASAVFFEIRVNQPSFAHMHIVHFLSMTMNRPEFRASEVS